MFYDGRDCEAATKPKSFGEKLFVGFMVSGAVLFGIGLLAVVFSQ